MPVTATPVSDKLKEVRERLHERGLESDASIVDGVRRECMAIERRASKALEDHYSTVTELQKEIAARKKAARNSANVDDRASASAAEIATILKGGGYFSSLEYVDGVERIRTQFPKSISVLRPVFRALKRNKSFRKKGDTLKFGKITIYGRKPSRT